MANPIIQKLNFKDQSPVLVLQAPENFEPVIGEWKSLTRIHTRLSAGTSYPFVLAFVQSAAAVAELAGSIVPALAEDAVCWMAYPKKSSKRYASTIHRDQGWSALGDLGFEPVRQVAIDEDWSALRFRRVEHIRTMTRRQEMTLSAAGKQKTRPASPSKRPR